MPSLKIILAQINPRVSDLTFNVNKICHAIDNAEKAQADLIIFPELALSGYPPEDLLLRQDFLDQIQIALLKIAAYKPHLYVILGHPQHSIHGLYNAASLLYEGKIIETYHKHILPNYGVFDEKRYFTKGHQTKIVSIKGVSCGLLICEDLWFPEPAMATQKAGAEILISINASPFDRDKTEQRLKILKDRNHETHLPIVYVNLVGGQDELVFDGGSLVMQEGCVVAQAEFFEEELLGVSYGSSPIKRENLASQPLIGPMGTFSGLREKDSILDQCTVTEIEHLYSALVLGTRDYLAKNNFKEALLGLSGGIDSALTLAIAVDAMGAENVEAIMMPSTYTSELSYAAAQEQVNTLKVKYQIISIEALYDNFLQALKNNLPIEPNKTHENLQARCRGVLLMALSNQTCKIVLTTGNKSELAVGYATLYGDMCGGFNPLKDVFKTQVYELAQYRNSLSTVIPLSVIERAPSAELAPNQTDQDTLPPYPILDNILQGYIEDNLSIEQLCKKGFEQDTVKKIVQMLNKNEYKRQQSAPGLRISKRAFGKDWRMPIKNTDFFE